MGDWISEHKGLFIAIIAGILVIALAIGGVLFFKGNNSKAKDNKNVSETDTKSAVVTTENGEQITNEADNSEISTDEVASSETTQAVTTTLPQTTSPSTPSPTGVLTKTDGNKKVYYPAALESAQKKYPVVVWANGTGCPTDSYDALLKKIADAGYIVVADSSVMTADGSAQRDSIDYIIGENGKSSSVFYGKVDTAKIGATGHSQGGRSSVNAAQKDSRIKCIVSIAGASSADEARGLSTPSLFLTGTSDMVVVSSQWCKPSYDVVTGRAVYASLKGGVHTTCMTNPEKVSEYIISWFDAYLKGDSTAKAKFANGGKLSTDSAWTDFAAKN